MAKVRRCVGEVRERMTLSVNSIICGECSEVMSQWPDECIDLTVTSPPYDNLRNYNGYVFPFEQIAQQLYRITKKGGVVVWVVADATINGSETGTSFKQALYFKEIGFNLHDTMIWEKPGFTAIGALQTRYAQVFEYMFIFAKDKISSFSPIKDRVPSVRGRSISGTKRLPDGTFKKASNIGKVFDVHSFRYNIWKINNEFSNNERCHPGQFPVQIASDHIISWSVEQDIILDPMCGSGTTAIAAIKTNRRFIGIDISHKYCELAKNRINRLLSQTTLDFGKNVKYEIIEGENDEKRS